MQKYIYYFQCIIKCTFLKLLIFKSNFVTKMLNFKKHKNTML